MKRRKLNQAAKQEIKRTGSPTQQCLRRHLSSCLKLSSAYFLTALGFRINFLVPPIQATHHRARSANLLNNRPPPLM